MKKKSKTVINELGKALYDKMVSGHGLRDAARIIRVVRKSIKLEKLRRKEKRI